MNVNFNNQGRKENARSSITSFSLLDLESGMRDYTTKYIIDDVIVTEDDNVRISFKINQEEGFTNRFFLFIKVSRARELVTLIDNIFFSKKPMKLERNPWVTFLFQDDARIGQDPGTIYMCKLIGGLPDKESVDFLLKWVYYAIDKEAARKEIQTIMESKEMETLEHTMNDLKKMGYAKELLEKGGNDPTAAVLRRIGLSEKFNPEKIAMEGLGYKQHGVYMLQEIKKDYVIVLSMLLGDAKILAEKIGPLTRV